MRTHILLTVALLVSCAAHGQAVIETSAGVITLYADAGGCVGAGRRAEWSSTDAQTRVPGCWIAAGGVVQIAWRDGDVTRAPMSAAVPAKGS